MPADEQDRDVRVAAEAALREQMKAAAARAERRAATVSALLEDAVGGLERWRISLGEERAAQMAQAVSAPRNPVDPTRSRLFAAEHRKALLEVACSLGVDPDEVRHAVSVATGFPGVSSAREDDLFSAGVGLTVRPGIDADPTKQGGDC